MRGSIKLTFPLIKRVWQWRRANHIEKNVHIILLSKIADFRNIYNSAKPLYLCGCESIVVHLVYHRLHLHLTPLQT